MNYDDNFRERIWLNIWAFTISDKNAVIHMHSECILMNIQGFLLDFSKQNISPTIDM